MEDKDVKNEQQQEGEVRQTVNAKEAFTLIKDVYDGRTLIKKIYNNRAIIGKRLNIISLIFSMLYTVIYVAYVLINTVSNRFSVGVNFTFYAALAINLMLIIGIIVVAAMYSKANTKTVKKYNKFLKIFRYAVKVTSLIMTIIAMVASSVAGEKTQGQIIIDTVFLIFSIISIIVHALPLIFGGLGGVARWLMSPVKRKVVFSEVALEWYQLVLSQEGQSNSVKKVEQKYVDDIGRVIDDYLIPKLGKRRITSIGMKDILNVLDAVEYDELFLVEGTFKNIFKYAEESNYIGANPCKNINMSGSINVEEKKSRPNVKNKLKNAVKKAGTSIIDKFLSGEESEE